MFLECIPGGPLLIRPMAGRGAGLVLAVDADDALPELVPLLNDADEETRVVIGGVLHYRFLQLTALPVGWPGWHWARARALDWLTTLRPVIETYEPARYSGRVPID